MSSLGKQLGYVLSTFRLVYFNVTGDCSVFISGPSLPLLLTLIHSCSHTTTGASVLLEAGFQKIACTQPHRIACISLAKRVGYETLNEYSSEIAYQVSGVCGSGLPQLCLHLEVSL